MLSSIHALLGGLIIGLSAAVLLIFNGRIAGISGMLSSSINLKFKENIWRILFILGMLFGGFLFHYLFNLPVPTLVHDNLLLAAFSGLLVGIGTRLANGCTSGHGVCGISRLSTRSIVATLTFITAGVLTVFITRLLSRVNFGRL